MTLTLHRLGRADDFASSFEQLQEGWAESNPLMIARVFAWTDDADSAFVWLERAREKGFETFFTDFSLSLDPVLLRLSGDPRWDLFLRDIGAAPEELAAIEFTYSLPQ